MLYQRAQIVSTGIEEKIALDSGQCLISDVEGVIEEVDAQHITIRMPDGKKKEYRLVNFERSNEATCLMQRPVVEKGMRVKTGDLLADSSTTENGSKHFRPNLQVALIPFYGTNSLEDAIPLFQRGY